MKKILIAISILLIFIVSCSKEVKENKKIGNDEAFSFQLKDFNGNTVMSESIFDNGKPTLLVFSAEWCPYCQEESPHIQEFYEKHGENINVVVIYISSRTSLEKSKEFIESNGYTYPAYYDENGTIQNAFNIRSIPTNFKIMNNKVVKELELPVDLQKMEIEFLN